MNLVLVLFGVITESILLIKLFLSIVEVFLSLLLFLFHCILNSNNSSCFSKITLFLEFILFFFKLISIIFVCVVLDFLICEVETDWIINRVWHGSLIVMFHVLVKEHG